MKSEKIFKYKNVFVLATIGGFLSGLILYSLRGEWLTVVFSTVGALMMAYHFTYLKEHRHNHNNSHLKF